MTIHVYQNLFNYSQNNEFNYVNYILNNEGKSLKVKKKHQLYCDIIYIIKQYIITAV